MQIDFANTYNNAIIRDEDKAQAYFVEELQTYIDPTKIKFLWLHLDVSTGKAFLDNEIDLFEEVSARTASLLVAQSGMYSFIAWHRKTKRQK